MKVNNASYVSMQPEVSQNEASADRSLKMKLNSAEKQLQDVGYNQRMSSDDKAKLRRELQKEIDDLNREIKRKELEEEEAKKKDKREALQQTDADKADKFIEDKVKEDNAKTDKAQRQDEDKRLEESEKAYSDSEEVINKEDFIQPQMKAMLSAEAVRRQVVVENNVASDIEHQSDVLHAEIELDKIRDVDVEAKEEKLDKLRNSIVGSEFSRIGSFKASNDELGKVTRKRNVIIQ
ncbi:MAG: FlxA-like family protein [Lachnospiraceae bacterium]|nr:FlxA-like family protein [Lachnospiraceae bacterium]